MGGRVIQGFLLRLSKVNLLPFALLINAQKCHVLSHFGTSIVSRLHLSLHFHFLRKATTAECMKWPKFPSVHLSVFALFLFAIFSVNSLSTLNTKKRHIKECYLKCTLCLFISESINKHISFYKILWGQSDIFLWMNIVYILNSSSFYLKSDPWPFNSPIHVTHIIFYPLKQKASNCNPICMQTRQSISAPLRKSSMCSEARGHKRDSCKVEQQLFV